MAVSVQMPKQGNTVEECLLVEWRVKEGDLVKTGDVLCAIETDKASFDVESTADGVVLKLLANAGDLVPVLTDIVVIGEAGEDVSAMTAGSAAAAPAQAQAQAETAPAPAAAATPEAAATRPADQARTGASPDGAATKAVSPRARKLAERLGVDASAVFGTGPGGRVVSRDVQSAVDNGVLRKATPLAKAVMAETGGAAPTGSGLGGMALARDVTTASPARRRDDVPTPPPVVVPYKGIRKLIGDRMLQSLAEHAQLTHNTSADASGLMALRKMFKDNGADAGLPNISINDLICWIVVRTLQSFPEMNATFDQKAGAITQYHGVNLGFAVDTPRGLLVPVVHDAHRMSLSELSAAMAGLAGDCRSGKINPDLLAGGTFTVSNLGSMGIESFTPIINADQVAILGVCAITTVAAPGADGGVVFRPRLGLSLTYDHQAVDGAPASRFLQAVAKGLEAVETALVLDGAR
ncbi:MAG: 2-oxo acid dehydrogenase subunit E2 [Planctomycetaceae bacterium]|nr:2-oxo acid dehydrogenase subunit E2 [Planctomycetaceae bacterium]